MSLENYLKAGGKHTIKDEEVDLNIISNTQKELNGNLSMIIKFCKMGHLWNQVDRVRSTMINGSLSLCPMYLTYKDHKGWTGEDDSPPPTRPIAGGNTGMNIHISEVISEMVEPMVDAFEGEKEIISTEDMKARIEIINEGNKDWNKWSWWDGKKNATGEYTCCSKCTSEEEEKLKWTLLNVPENYKEISGQGWENLKGNAASVPEKYKESSAQGWDNTDVVKGTQWEEINYHLIRPDQDWDNIKGNTGCVPENYKEISGQGWDGMNVCDAVKGTLWDEGFCECEDEENIQMIENWENFWETERGKDPTFWTVSQEEWEDIERRRKGKKVKPWKMKQIRRQEWMEKHSQEDLEDKDKLWRSYDMNAEDIQDQESKMVIIGCDVEALYPSLEVNECGRIVEEEVMRSSIKWEDLDYLEGARLIALNRSAEYCRVHQLHRVLPVRRGKTGVRPGVTGKGPMGEERGDQEQWRFPKVKLTEVEKRMIVGEVMKIITELMFENHLYTFGGRVFRQRRGGAIGLRGTCAIAWLVMCQWDRLWLEMMEKNRIE